MNIPTPEQKIKSIYQMLFEMATGNLAFRIEPASQDDGLNRLIILLNQLAERMRITLLHHEYVSPHYTYQGLVQLTLILDNNYIIRNCNGNVQTFLGYSPENLIGNKLPMVIARQSAAIWDTVSKEAATNPNYHTTIQLIFTTPQKKLIPSFCTISRLIHSNHMIISSVTTILQDIIYNLPSSSAANKKSKVNDAETMQLLYDFILQHLEKPLPTIRQLAAMFRVNEFELKSGFRTFFNTSIHHFYNDERLKKAHLMITQTGETLKTVAFACGFTNYNNFYKAFKKRFGYAPTRLLRNKE